METLLQDLRFGARMLLRNPAFTAVAVIALALGIGANSAIFTVVNTVLLRPLPFPEPERIVQLWTSAPQLGLPQTELSFQRLTAITEQNQTLEKIGAYTPDTANLTGVSDPLQLKTMRISSGLLDVLKVKPALGRNFTPDEDKRGGNPAVILSHPFWESQFGSDPGVIGKAISLDGTSTTIIGVMPAGFDFIKAQIDIWVTSVSEPTFFSKGTVDHGGGYLYVLGRLKPGANRQQLQSELESIIDNNRIPGNPDATFGIVTVSWTEQLTGNIRPTLLVMLGAVVFVLLIACANVANLLLAKAVGRQKEITVRAALGASRSRLIQQFLTESILLAVISSALGMFLATEGVELLTARTATILPRTSELSVDGKVLGFTILITVLTSLIFGLAPALHASKIDLNESLKDSSRGSTGGLHRNRLRSALVIVEVALSVVLLVGAGLLIRSFIRLQGVNPGLNPNNVIVADISLPRTRYSTQIQVKSFYRSVEQELSTIPGVVSVGAIQYYPFSGGNPKAPIAIDGRPLPPPQERPIVSINTVSANYFKTMGIPLERGRYFDDRDNETVPPVVVINQTFKNRFFPDEDAVGKRLNLGAPKGIEIVGVVGDVHHLGLDQVSPAAVYFCAGQGCPPAMGIVLRTIGSPLNLTKAIRSKIATIDKDQPVASFQTMDEAISKSIASHRFTLVLIGSFAGIALLLASIGIYSVMAYMVSQRTGEIGLRMALGAQPSAVLHMVVRQGLNLILIGLGIGLVVALGLTRVAASLLFDVSPRDPVTFTVTPLLLICIALLACFIPARRATRIDPLAALRYE
ncbi:MAG TPA: ABC transporter permease [Blastocatellia bacterium]|nr:ABC transporter permease [Blastocatellia bacterium]